MIKRIWQRIRFHVADRAPEMALIFFFVTFLVVLFKDNIFITVEQGHYGVVWHRFYGGTDLDSTYPEGVHAIFPWDKMIIFDGRLQMVDQELDVLSADGLALTIELTYRFELNPKEIPTLARYIGPDFNAKMIAPSVSAHARAIFSSNSPEEIFARRRDELNNLLTTKVKAELDSSFIPSWRTEKTVNFVEIEDVVIRGITLPTPVAAAIEQKNIAKQRNEAYDFRLLSEAKESERKQIEARGIKSFQDIVAPGLTDTYLRWQGIQATQALANSPNSKLVVIGGGKDGMPIILGGWEGGAPLTTTPALPAAPANAAAQSNIQAGQASNTDVGAQSSTTPERGSSAEPASGENRAVDTGQAQPNNSPGAASTVKSTP